MSRNEGNAPDKSLDTIIDQPVREQPVEDKPASAASLTIQKDENALKLVNEDVSNECVDNDVIVEIEKIFDKKYEIIPMNTPEVKSYSLTES